SDDLHAADENADDLGRVRLDLQRQDGIHHASGHDVDQTGSFFKPGIAPGCDHRLSLLLVKAMLDKNILEIGLEIRQIPVHRLGIDRDLAANGAGKLISEFPAAILKLNQGANRIRAEVLNQHSAAN